MNDESKKQYEKMPRVQFYNLCKWLERNAETCADKNYAQVASLASKGLGAIVNGNQVKEASEATGVQLSPVVKKTAAKIDVAELKELIGTLATNQRVLAEVLEKSCSRDQKERIDAIKVNTGRIRAKVQEL